MAPSGAKRLFSWELYRFVNRAIDSEKVHTSSSSSPKVSQSESSFTAQNLNSENVIHYQISEKITKQMANIMQCKYNVRQ